MPKQNPQARKDAPPKVAESVKLAAPDVKVEPGKVVFRACVGVIVPNSGNEIVTDGAIFYVPVKDAPGVQKSGYGFLVEEPALDLTFREVCQVNGGEVPSFA